MNLAGLRALLPGVAPRTNTWYRIIDARFTSEIDEIAHTVLYSWRYNPKGEFGVLYLALSADCAYRERLRQAHGRAEDLPPLCVGTFKVRLTKCLDLTSPPVCAKLGIAASRLLSTNDFSVAQSIAREARRVGFEAIVAPSAVGDDCRNLVVFKDKLLPPSRCICDPESIQSYP
ncbi:MAG: hypothetical protein A3G41_08175 [Elusimicrobia bacterium RIFCSPLOWO2_12_FULL_59_9]|nr:MAG: hypothetical protein A3G41_08175 [Elusimicrobia bacterium RIFCSPLOWO2_12_FULL_59_9]